MIANHILMSCKTDKSSFMPSWGEDLEYNWLEAPSIVVRKSLEKSSQGGKDAPIGNQGHEAGASFDLNIVHIEQIHSRFYRCTMHIL